MKRTIFYIILLSLILPMASCSRDIVSSDHRDLPEHGWAMTDTAYLTLNVPDTTEFYDLTVTLRHTEQYAYQNLWLFISACDSLSPIQADTVMACLADDRGQWLARRTGRYYTGFVTMQRKVVFPAAGDYTFAVVQGMRDSVIAGIADVGIELRKVKGEN